MRNATFFLVPISSPGSSDYFLAFIIKKSLKKNNISARLTRKKQTLGWFESHLSLTETVKKKLIIRLIFKFSNVP